VLVYIFAAVFGVGVTLVDMLGLLGASDDGASDSADGEGDGDGAGEVHAPVLSFMRWLRVLVYFCLGFGPFGLVADRIGNGGITTLLWAGGGGVVSGALARAFFRFQGKVIDSSLADDDMLFEQAYVTVPVSDTDMGRVRIHIGQTVAERFALAADPDTFYAADAEVRIVSITDDCVYVRATDDDALDADTPSFLM
jgi:hypothetical protein